MNEWERVVEADEGAVLWEYHDEANDVHGYVIRGPGALCGYVGTRQVHAVWSWDKAKEPGYLYDYGFSWIPVHGGMTYDGALEGTRAHRPGYYYIGWDYAHAGDTVAYREASGIVPYSIGGPGHKWTVPEVAADVCRVARIFTNYKTLIENVEAGICDRSAVELFKRLEDLD